MTLSDKQKKFTWNIGLLIQFAWAKGFELTFGEATRPQSQALLNYYGYDVVAEKGTLTVIRTSQKSKTLESRHLSRLAVDFNIFKGGRLLFSDSTVLNQDLKDAQVLGDYWISLNTDNVWGGDWNRNHDALDEKFKDPYHFECKP